MRQEVTHMTEISLINSALQMYQNNAQATMNAKLIKMAARSDQAVANMLEQNVKAAAIDAQRAGIVSIRV